MSGARVAGWRRLGVMTAKELKQLFRDAVLMAFFVYAFSADIYLAASGVSLEIRNAALGVLDHDRSADSRELIGRFQPPHFRLFGEVGDDRRALALLDAGTVMAVLDVPPRFSEQLQRGEQTAVQLQIDTTNSIQGFLASAYAAQIVGQFGFEVASRREGWHGPLEAPLIGNRPRVWFNPNETDSWFMGISELLTIITLFSILLPAAAMVREKERGTIEQLLVSPLTPFQIMFPKVAAMTAVILVGAALTVYGILQPVFDVPFKGSAVAFFSVTALYVFTTAGLGMLAATVARNLAQVAMLTVVILMPMLLLSGAWTPPEAMPPWMRGVAYASPLHYFLDTAFGILLKGATLADLWDSLLAMAGLGAAVFGIGLWRFRRQFG